MMLKFYDTVIELIFLYGCELWGEDVAFVKYPICYPQHKFNFLRG